MWQMWNQTLSKALSSKWERLFIYVRESITLPKYVGPGEEEKST